MSSSSIKVLYIAGAGRSGSTVLCNLLGQLDGFVSCGELYNLHNAPPDRQYCGCGKLLSQCEVWDPILRSTLGNNYVSRSPDLLHSRNKIARNRYVLLWAMPSLHAKLLHRAQDYLALTGQIYRQISDVTTSRVIVDSSKATSYSQILTHIPNVDLRLLHLVRDARAVAYSWQRKKAKPSPTGSISIRTASPVARTLEWMTHNAAIETLTTNNRVPYLRIRYETFTRSPQETLEQIMQFVGEHVSLPTLEDNQVDMKVHHTVSGNPDRFRTGPVELKPDDEWQTKMKPIDRVIATCLTWPFLLRYGYRL